MIKWQRSNEGYCESKCERFSIEPLFFGCCSPQCYTLSDNVTKSKHTEIDTQKECKELAEGLL